MKLNFNKITLHNFGSYADSTLDLNNKGYCLVSGINKFKKDNAVSNGAGKSFIWSAICYALTGETLNGLTNNLKNVYIDDEDCYVTLELTVDNDEYTITRIHKPKSDLKIILNGVDISGKGVRESEVVLGNYLPELTKDLIASVILVGQGMPNKFSSFTPAGRKELLEKLSKSDFMIEDIKTKITSRLTTLENKIKEYDELLLVTKTQEQTNKAQLEGLKKELEDLGNPNYNELIPASEEQVSLLKIKIEQTKASIKESETKIETLTNSLIEETGKKQVETNGELNAYNEKRNLLVEAKNKNELKIDSLREEIKKLKEIKDICPTCGQKIPGVHKHDTSTQEATLLQLQEDLKINNKDIDECNQKHIQYTQDISSIYDAKLANIKENLDEQKLNLDSFKNTLNTDIGKLSIEETRLTKLLADQTSYETNKTHLTTKIKSVEDQIEAAITTATTYTNKRVDVLVHYEMVKKMDMYVKRDFRGYLLKGLIEFLDKKCKEYSSEVFGTTELDFKLDGNNINISYCGKAFDNLSGGEKQRVDLILQFAIRDLMRTCLGFSSNILVLDEIFDFLDAKATDAIINLINTKLADAESVFIISHHADELELTAESEVLVVKNENGISEII